MLGHPVLDPIAAILVSGWIIKTGITIGYEAVAELTDTRVEKSILLSIGKFRTVLRVLNIFIK
ncbi:hypothetical protein KKA14_00435 [bacterium]|nr:hypothetical protein [bacterium]